MVNEEVTKMVNEHGKGVIINTPWTIHIRIRYTYRRHDSRNVYNIVGK